MIRYVVLTVLLAGCNCDQSSIPYVTKVGDCSQTACRVIVSDGSRATVRRPVMIGDRILRTLGGEAFTDVR